MYSLVQAYSSFQKKIMILCLDAGNTRFKCGVHDGQKWHMQRAFEYDALSGLANLLPALLPLVPRQIMACNVAGSTIRLKIERLAQQLTSPLTWLESTSACCGVRNGYDRPAQLGADRWAGLIATRALSSEASIVVLAGTATTIDLLDAEGVFRGGLILPGLTLMRRSLASNTDQLPDVFDVSGHLHELPKNTNDAITSGALHATLGAIERMRLSHGVARCILSGGAAADLLPYLAVPTQRIDYLVLEGLLQVANASAPA